MRILFLAPFAAGGPKGTTRWRVLPLARALAAQGHSVRVLIPPYDCPQQSGMSWLDQGGVQVDNLRLPPFRSSLGQLALAQKLAQAAVAWQPHVVHCFKPKGPAGLTAWMLDRKPGWRVPLVMDADDWEVGWNAVVAYPSLWQKFFRWQEHWGLRRAYAVTAASRWLVDYAIGLRNGTAAAVGSGDFRVTYLPNGVDPVSFPVRQETNCPPTVLAYTRFIEHTPEHLICVWKRVLVHEPEARLIVAGPGPGVEASRFLDAAKTAKVSHSVLMAGWIPSTSRAGLFAAVDVAVLPVSNTPLNRAKSPMRLLDLLAAGVPVATQDVGEYGCLVSDGVTGLVTEPGSDAALAAAVVRLLRAPNLRGRLGQAAAATMQIEYTWSILAQRALSAYQKALVAKASP